MSLSVPPRPDELEVSLFGPGIGECVVVHVGGGEWITVDSCEDPATHAPAALAYLRSLGVDPGTQVKRVIVTHWHDDHMRGAAGVLAAATSAKFFCSAALSTKEFLSFIASSSALNTKSDGSSGVAEFSAIMDILQARRAGGARAESVGPEWTRADMVVYARAESTLMPRCEVFALSPSSATLSRSLHEIAQQMPKLGAPKRAAVSIAPNETSVVIGVRLGDAVALLGGDLENTAAQDRGWSAVLTTQLWPQMPMRVFKVAHHGSENADHPGVWSRFASDFVAIATPFATGKKSLPSDDDVARIKARTSQFFVSAPPPARGAASDAVVQKTINEVARSFRQRTARMGHIRVRLSASTTPPTIELFGAARAA